eukprot:gene8645-592_t
MTKDNLENKLDGLEYFEKRNSEKSWYEEFILYKYFILLKKYPGFRYLWIGSIISIFGDFFTYLSCVEILNTYSSDSNSLLISIYILCEMLPSTLVTGLSGTIADTFDRRKIMFICDVLRSIFALIYLWVDSTEKIWILYLITSLQSICGGFFGPSRSALLPNTILDSDDLIISNSLNGSVFPIACSFGSGLGGLFLTFFGTNFCFLMDSFSYILSSLCILMLFKLDVKDKKESKSESKSECSTNLCTKIWQFFKMNFEIFSYFYDNLDTFIIALSKPFAGITFGALEILHLIYMENNGKILNNSSISIGLYYLVMGIASFFAPMIVTKYCKQIKRYMNIWICFGFLIQFLGNFISSFSFHFLWVMFFGAVIRPIGESFIFTLSLTYLQRSVSDSIRGRIFSFSRSSWAVFKSITSVSIGLLSKYGKMSNQSLMYIFSINNGLIFLMFCIYLIIFSKLENTNRLSSEWIDE